MLWLHPSPKHCTQEGALDQESNDPAILFVCNSNEANSWTKEATPGFYVSVDSGQNWATSPATNLPYSTIYDLVIDPHRPTRLYAATPSGILKLELPEDFYEKINPMLH